MRIPLPASLKSIRLFVRVTGPGASREIQAVLDTGATFTVIGTGLALRLGYDLARAPRVRVLTANGLLEAPRITLDSVSAADVCAERVEALCHDMPGGQVSALLGLSFLEHVRLRLDLKGRALEMEDP